MPSGLSQSHQEIAGQFQRELLQLICLGSGGQHVQRPLPRGMGRPIGLQCPCNSFTRQEVRGASDSTNQRIENNALVSSSGFTGGARRVVYLVTSYSKVRWREFQDDARRTTYSPSGRPAEFVDEDAKGTAQLLVATTVVEVGEVIVALEGEAEVDDDVCGGVGGSGVAGQELHVCVHSR